MFWYFYSMLFYYNTQAKFQFGSRVMLLFTLVGNGNIHVLWRQSLIVIPPLPSLGLYTGCNVLSVCRYNLVWCRIFFVLRLNKWFFFIIHVCHFPWQYFCSVPFFWFIYVLWPGRVLYITIRSLWPWTWITRLNNWFFCSTTYIFHVYIY
jgi:hypothetical protein